MENRTTILNELKKISPMIAGINPFPYNLTVPEGYFEGLAESILQRIKAEIEISSVVVGIGNKNPYQVPTGYFDGLAENILLRIKSEEETASPVLQKIGSVNPYNIPTGYFDGLAENILQRIKSDEETTSPVLHEISNKNPYTVPAGYFDGLAENILLRIKMETVSSHQEELEMLSPLLSKLDKKLPFTTPAGYFDELSNNVVGGVKAIEFVNEELENLSPVMHGLKHKNVYEAPDGYFDALPQQILNKVRAAQPAKVVSMSFNRKVMRYAVAAMVAGLMFTAGWFAFNNSNPQMDAPTADVKKISDDEIINYLENEDVAFEETTVANNSGDEIDMKEMLADVSDEELQHYVEQHGNSKEL